MHRRRTVSTIDSAASAPRRSRALQEVLRRSALFQSLLIITVVAVALLTTVEYQDLVRQQRRASEALVGITEIRSEMQNAEDALRSYVLSAAPATLDSFNRSSGVVSRTASRVQGSLDPADFAALRRTAERFETWKQEFALVAIADVLAGRQSDAPEASTDRFQAAISDIETSVRAELDRVGDRLDTAAPISVVSMLAAGLTAIVVAFAQARRLQRNVASPMVELASDTLRLGDGDLGVRSSASGVAEIDDIAGAFNAMASQLEMTVAGLRELDELKSDFVSMVSHELRTPLTSILGYTDALLAEEPGPLNEEQGDYARAVERNAKRLQALVDDLLTLSRLDAGRIKLDLVPIAIGRVATSTCRDLQHRAEHKGVQLTVDVLDDVVVNGDASRLAQIVTNLVANAVKFTPSGKSVHVVVRADGADAVISVIDEGIGIPADELPRLFERFFRSRTARAIEGTGLGLAITHELVELLGGQLSVESEEGRGSTFTVRFPVTAGAEAVATPGG